VKFSSLKCGFCTTIFLHILVWHQFFLPRCTRPALPASPVKLHSEVLIASVVSVGGGSMKRSSVRVRHSACRMVLLVMFASGLTATRIPLFAQLPRAAPGYRDRSQRGGGRGRGSNDKIGCHGSTRRMATTEVGTYSAVALLPGEYVITYEAPGFTGISKLSRWRRRNGKRETSRCGLEPAPLLWTSRRKPPCPLIPHKPSSDVPGRPGRLRQSHSTVGIFSTWRN